MIKEITWDSSFVKGNNNIGGILGHLIKLWLDNLDWKINF